MRAGRQNGISGRQKQRNAAKPRAPSPERPHPAIAKLAVALREYQEAVGQQAATAEILRALSRASSDPQPVFEAIVGNAYRMTGAAISILYRYDGELLSVVAERHVSAAGARALRALYPAPPRRDHFVGRAVLEGRAMHSADAPNDPRFPGNKNVFAKAVPYRAALAVPLLKDGKVLGAIATERLEPKAFSKKEIDLLRTFADEAVIAMENVRLFNETKNALARQTATAEILRVLGSSVTDVQPVFDAIVKNCHDLFKDSGVVLRLVSDGQLHVKASVGYAAEPVPIERTSAVGACVIDARTIHLPDLEEATKQFPRIRQLGPKYGYRSLIYAPLMRGGQAIGAIGVLRCNLGGFEDKDVQLLKTFADQAVIAIENVRLFNETEEALEHQKASADILRIVAGSVENTDPVFEAITAAGMRLIPGSRVALILVRDGKLHYASHSGVSEERRAALAKLFPMPLDKDFVAGATVIGKRTIHIPDFKSASARFKRSIEVSRVSGYRAMLSVPLIHGDKAIGVIAVSRESPGAFTDKQIALVQTFADQAVIAVRNAQFFREIRDRNSELKQSLEFQGASAEILSSISSSIADTKPVFDAIVRNVVRLCGTQYAAVLMVRGEQLELAAVTGSHRLSKEYAATFPQPVDHSTLTGKVLLSGKVMQLAPIIGNPQSSEQAVALARRFGYNAMILAPMIRDDKVIGVIGTARAEATGFDDKQVALLKAFADQAVIAIENARLFNETKEALERQTATSAVLRVISQSQTDAQPAFDAIIHSAVRLCAGTYGHMTRVDGDMLHLWAHHGTSPQALEMLATRYPAPLSETSLIALAVHTRSLVHSPDTLNDPRASHKTYTKALNLRAQVSVPLIKGDTVIGVLNVQRDTPGPFSEEQLELLRTFADQAVIAIENARLFNETKEALEQQTGTAQVLSAISGSPTDVAPVYQTILQNATRLCEASFAVVFLYDAEHLTAAAHLGASSAFAKHLDESRLRPSRETTTRLAALEKRIVQVEDLLNDPQFSPSLAHHEENARAVLSVPMLREGALVGVITVWRREPRRFTDKQVALLKTFADQAVIAIENVRLFNETKESLEQQTAISDVLRVISNSPTDVHPVLQAVAERAARICEASDARVAVLEGESVRDAAGYGDLGEAPGSSVPLEGSVTGRAIAGRLPVQIDVAEASESDFPFARRMYKQRGHRIVLAIPLLRENQALGAIVLRRKDAQLFTEKQITLLKTFADQAAIAIENVRLFNETKESLERQTATAEILRVISSTPTDTQPVFDAIVQSAQRLMAGKSAALVLRRESEFFVAAYSAPGLEDMPAEVRTVPLDRTKNFPSRVILDGELLHIPDWEAEDVPEHEKVVAKAFGFGSGLQIPLLREGQGIGALVVSRQTKGPFHEKEIALLRSFADQAVIAIENVRLFNETKEALERQTATAEILRVISSTPTDTQPVFDAIVQSAQRLMSGKSAILLLRRATDFFVAAYSIPGLESLPAEVRTAPLDRDKNFPSQVMLDRKIVHVPDWEADDVIEFEKFVAKAYGIGSGLQVPLVRKGEGIGSLAVTRETKGPFSEKEIALLQSFADQAVIAIENVRLFNETKESLEQQTATAEILKVISSSPTDTQPVFEAIVRTAVRLFGTSVVLRLVKGNLMERVAELSPGDRELKKGDPPLDEGSFSGRAILRRELVHIPDISTETWTSDHTKQIAVRGGYRSGVFVPMMREGEAIGAVGLLRHAPGSFNDKQIALLRTFADQAVIAIENVRLFKELEARTEALSKSVRQLTALGEVGQAVTSTLELETVLKTIVQRAVQLTGLDGGSIYEYDARTEEFSLQAAENMEQELVEAVRRTPVRKGDGAIGQSAVSLEPVQVPDILDDSYRSTRKEVLVRAGYRAILAVPLLREAHILGAILVYRRTPGSFAPEVVELLKTFATQSAMAIQNARLFREIAEKGKQLELASRHKSDFLASMSHELRTPLNALLGFNEMILGDIYGEVPSDMKPPLAQMQSSGKHLLRLINNVLDLAKIEAGRMELALSDYSVHDTVESVRSTLRPLAADKGLELLAAVQAEIPLAYGDAGRITQCLMNLAGNSLKFTKAGKVEISAALNDGWLRYRVADTGIGIPPEKLGSLFTEFKQTDATIASEYGGTGLGLSISKKFVELHGGRIWVESEPGKGSVFTFEIPLRAKTA